jgi:hypothetical protein
MSVQDLIETVGAKPVANLLSQAARERQTSEYPPDDVRDGNNDIAARRALAEFDEHIAAYLDRYPKTLTGAVTVRRLADFNQVDRQKYYRLLKGLHETPLKYIRRRLPELRDRLASLHAARDTRAT